MSLGSTKSWLKARDEISQGQTFPFLKRAPEPVRPGVGIKSGPICQMDV